MARWRGKKNEKERNIRREKQGGKEEEKGEDMESERESRKNRDRVEIEKNKIKNIRFFPVYQYFIPKTNLPMKSILIKFLKSIEIKFLKIIVTCSPIYFLLLIR